MKYTIINFIDAVSYEDIEANNLEEVLKKYEGYCPGICHQCSDDIEVGDIIDFCVLDENQNEIYTTKPTELHLASYEQLLEELLKRDPKKTKNALKSFYGSKDRQQEIHTPDWVIDVVKETLGGAIDLDPCAASSLENWFATNNITLPDDSLKIDWTQYGNSVYVNPPYKYLKKWLLKCSQTPMKIVALVPVRVHRKWFNELTKDAEIVFLDGNFKFKGYKDTYPVPLCLVSWNCKIPSLGTRETNRRAKV